VFSPTLSHMQGNRGKDTLIWYKHIPKSVETK